MAPMASISPRLPQPPPELNFVLCSVLLPVCSVQCAVCSVQCGTIKGLRSNKLDLLCPILWGLWQQFLVMIIIIVIICLNQKFIAHCSHTLRPRQAEWVHCGSYIDHQLIIIIINITFIISIFGEIRVLLLRGRPSTGNNRLKTYTLHQTALHQEKAFYRQQFLDCLV